MIISSHVDMFRHLWRNQHGYNKKIQTCDGTKTRLCTERKLLRPRLVQRTRSSKHRNRATLDGGPTDRCQYVLCHLSVWVEPFVYTIATSHVLPAELWKTPCFSLRCFSELCWKIPKSCDCCIQDYMCPVLFSPFTLANSFVPSWIRSDTVVFKGRYMYMYFETWEFDQF